MNNIFILIILLFFVACSEENDKTNKSENANQPKQHVVIFKEENNPVSVLNDGTKEQEDNISHENYKSKNDEVSSSLNQNTHNQDNILESPPTFHISKGDIVLGNINSNVVVVEYFSPTCPHCAYYNKVVFPQIKEKYIDTNKIIYIIREFIGSAQDLDAAILERCNGTVESFLQFHSVLLAQQNHWAFNSKYRESLMNIAKIGGISDETYEKCLKNNEIIEILIANTKFVSNMPKFVGTPAFFVNGIQTTGYSFTCISDTVEKTLKKCNENSNS